MIENLIILIVALGVLLLGSEFLVRAAVGIAKKLGVSKFAIGLSLVALGTSIPELAAVVMASLKHESGIVIGGIVGSNIANIGLVIGVSALISTVFTDENIFNRDGYILLFSTLVFVGFMLDLTITRMESVILLLLYFSYVVFIFENKKTNNHPFMEYLDYFAKFRYIRVFRHKVKAAFKVSKKEKMKSEPFVLILGSLGVVLGARYLVNEIIYFAEFFQVPTTIISIIILALGTSLPELMVTFSAARQGHGKVAMGNIIGSNIANTFLVLGAAGLIFPIKVLESTLIFSAPFMVLLTVLFLLFIKTDWKITKMEGVVLLALYICFIVTLLATAW